MQKCRLAGFVRHNVFALYIVWGLKPFLAEILLTMILCLIDICKAKINFFHEVTAFANALYFCPNYLKRVLAEVCPTQNEKVAMVTTLF